MLKKGRGCIIIYVWFFRFAEKTVLPHGTTPKIPDFRTFLEILSFALAGKPTDANFARYNLCDIIFALTKIIAPPFGFAHIP